MLSASLARGEHLASPSTGEKRVLGPQHQRGFRPWTDLLILEIDDGWMDGSIVNRLTDHAKTRPATWPCAHEKG